MRHPQAQEGPGLPATPEAEDAAGVSPPALGGSPALPTPSFQMSGHHNYEGINVCFFLRHPARGAWLWQPQKITSVACSKRTQNSLASPDAAFSRD